MWLRSGMKFWYRVVALVVLVVLGLGAYLSMPDGQAQVEMNQQHRRMLQGRRGGGWGPLSKLQFQKDPGMCSAMSGSPHHANISSMELYQNAQFNLKSDGDWEIPLPTQDFRQATKEPRLNVILLPHSHNDPGWLKTVNEYYSDQTKHILNNMVNKLTQYPKMTFVWAETVYFSMWWNELEDAVKVHVRRLIRRGQLEIALGGWVMPDEASTHYVAVIDQLVEGHQWLWENLRVRPENSWSIDPFGHSGTMPYLWQLAGMTNMVIQRVHQAVKASLMKEKALEFNWRQMWDAKGSTDILCHIMPFMLYSIKYTCGPKSFACLYYDFRQISGDYTESRATDITQENLHTRAETLYIQYRSKAFYYKYNTILVPIGDDFRYDREIEWDQQYSNYEKLIQYMNSNKDWNINVQWGTLKDYFLLMRQEQVARQRADKDEQLPVLSGDFFPYSDRDGAYWTGYYTTRPFDKYFSRDVQWTLQAADILNTLSYAFYRKWKLPTDGVFFQYSSLLQQARRSLGLFLHHDAITGTAKEFVVQDYEQYLLKAYNQSQDVMRRAVQALLSNGKVETPVVFRPETVRRTFQELPKKQVIVVKQAGTTVVFFNSLGQTRSQMVHLLVDTPSLDVLSQSQEVLLSQVSPVWHPEEDALVLDDRFELTFIADVKPFSISTFMLYKRPSLSKMSYTSTLSTYNTDQLGVPLSLHFRQGRPEPKRSTPIFVDNGVIKLKFNPNTGSLMEVEDIATGNVTELNLNFEYYISHGSGAYLFFPHGPSIALFSNIPVIKVTQGPMMTRVEVGFEPYITHRVTLYSHPSHLSSAIYIENVVNIQTLKDKEVIMRFYTDVKNKDLSYFTDQNGFQFLRRQTSRTLRTQANYYPITSGVILEDESLRLNLLSAQPHGVSCLEEGQLEVMLDRQLVYDDNRGLGEGVQDIKSTVSRFVLFVERRKEPALSTGRSQYAMLSLAALTLLDSLQQPLFAFFTHVDTDVFYRSVNPVVTPLPCDLSVVSMRSLVNGNLNYNGTSVIFHRRGYDCGFATKSLLCYPSDSSLSFDSLFKEFSFSNLHETTLTHTTVKRAVNPAEKLKIAPMNIAAFHLHF